MKTLGAAVLVALVLAMEASGGNAKPSGACWHRAAPSATTLASREPRRSLP